MVDDSNTRPSQPSAEKMGLVEELRDPETLADLRNCNRGQTAALLERAAEALGQSNPNPPEK